LDRLKKTIERLAGKRDINALVESLAGLKR
jgi:hypothetical protein